MIAYYKLSNALYFQYEFDYVQIGPGSGITWESCIDDYNQYGDPNCPWTAISDTGTSFIGGPQSSTDNIAAEVGAEWDDEYVNFLRFLSLCNKILRKVVLKIFSIKWNQNLGEKIIPENITLRF